MSVSPSELIADLHVARDEIGVLRAEIRRRDVAILAATRALQGMNRFGKGAGTLARAISDDLIASTNSVKR